MNKIVFKPLNYNNCPRKLLLSRFPLIFPSFNYFSLPYFPCQLPNTTHLTLPLSFIFSVDSSPPHLLLSCHLLLHFFLKIPKKKVSKHHLLTLLIIPPFFPLLFDLILMFLSGVWVSRCCKVRSGGKLSRN